MHRKRRRVRFMRLQEYRCRCRPSADNHRLNFYCSSDHCNVELKDYPEYLKSIPSCSVIFDPCRTVLEDTERCHITASTSTDTPNSTPNDSEGTPSTRTPTHTSLTTPILTPVSTVTSNAPIGGQTDSLTATPTASPAPSSDGPGLSPGVIATIVVSTVTVIGAPLWLIRCYRHRRPRATSSVEENASPKPAEKRNESVVMGYTELLGMSILPGTRIPKSMSGQGG